MIGRPEGDGRETAGTGNGVFPMPICFAHRGSRDPCQNSGRIRAVGGTRRRNVVRCELHLAFPRYKYQWRKRCSSSGTSPIGRGRRSTSAAVLSPSPPPGDVRCSTEAGNADIRAAVDTGEHFVRRDDAALHVPWHQRQPHEARLAAEHCRIKPVGRFRKPGVDARPRRNRQRSVIPIHPDARQWPCWHSAHVVTAPTRRTKYSGDGSVTHGGTSAYGISARVSDSVSRSA